MKKLFCGVMVLMMVSLGLFISCKKTEQPASRTTEVKSQEPITTPIITEQPPSRTTEVKPQEPIIIADMADFEFTPGYDVPGTLFQSDFYWAEQDGRTVYLSLLSGGLGWLNFQEAPRRFDFTKGDRVTVVFKVQKYPSSSSFDLVSIEKK